MLGGIEIADPTIAAMGGDCESAVTIAPLPGSMLGNIGGVIVDLENDTRKWLVSPS